MILKIKVLLLLIISVVIGCNNSKKTEIELSKGYAIVKGKVSNFGNGSKVISFSGKTITGEIYQTAIIDSLGYFRTEIELFNPQNVNLSYENRGTHLYIKPNDSLFLSLDGNLIKQNKYLYFDISGSNPATSENIRDFLIFHDPYSFEPNYGDSVSVKKYLNDLEQQMSVEDSVLQEFSKQYNPTQEFMHWAKKNMKYTYSRYLYLYYLHFAENYKLYKTGIYDTDLFPVDDDSAIVSDGYKTYLTDYWVVRYFQGDSVTTKLFKEKNIARAYSRMFDNMVKTEKKGLSRDIMMFFILNQLSSENYSPIFSSFGKYFENQELVNILQEKKYQIENQVNDKENLVGLKLNTKSDSLGEFWEIISSKHKDKIIYIDIWATWCGPCRSEVPHAIELHNYFEGKPVAFVNLCMASKKDDWKKFITQNHINGDNYFFNEDETKLLRDELKFHGYPTYMIIDKKGNLINKNAPRPSSGDEIKSLLNKLL